MKKVWVIFFLGMFCMHSQIPTEIIFFESGKSNISKLQKIRILYYLSRFDKQSTYNIHIKGFSDSSGSSKLNHKLSKKRVRTVMDFIEDSGFEISEIHNNIYGEKLAKTNYTSEEEKMYERRVEFYLKDILETPTLLSKSKEEEIPTQVKREPVVKKDNIERVISSPKRKLVKKVKVPEIKTLQELYRTLPNKGQKFKVRTDLDTFIEGNQGTVIYIPKYTFKTEEKIISVYVKENVKRSDLFFQSFEENIKVDADYDIQESLYIRAYNNTNEKVAINKGHAIGVMIPTYKINPGLKVIPTNTEIGLDGEKHKLSHFRMIDYVEFDRHGHLDFSKRRFSWFKKKPKNDRVEEVLAVGDSVVFASVYLESIKKRSTEILCKAFEVYNIESAKDFSDSDKKPLLRKLRVMYPDTKKENLSYKDIKHHEYLKRRGKMIRYDKLHYYLLDTDAQGWLLMGEQRVLQSVQTIKVHVVPKKNIDVKLVSKTNNIVLSPSKINKENYEFNNISNLEEYSIFGIKYGVKGEIEKAITDVHIDKNSYYLKFETSNKEELKGILNSVDQL